MVIHGQSVKTPIETRPFTDNDMVIAATIEAFATTSLPIYEVRPTLEPISLTSCCICPGRTLIVRIPVPGSITKASVRIIAERALSIHIIQRTLGVAYPVVPENEPFTGFIIGYSRAVILCNNITGNHKKHGQAGVL
jgi:hypothetical protein